MTWKDLLREELKALAPYRAATSRAAVRLDANESPLALPEAVRQDLARELAELPLNRYPDILAGALRERLAARIGVAPDRLVVGNGADELIGMLALALARPPRKEPKARVCYPVPSFVMYRIWTMAVGSAPLEVPLRPDFSLDEPALERAIVAGQPNIIFLARPNNPTGTLWPRDVCERVVKAHPGVLIVLDEAYHEYAGEHALDWIDTYENVVVLRTLSKLGLAGLRIGALVGRPELVAELEKVRAPYNVSLLDQRAATVLLERHWELLLTGVKEVVAERERLAERLAADGAHVFPSAANFLMIRVADADAVWAGLEARGVLVKSFHKKGAALDGCLRITVGTRAENDALLAAFAALDPGARHPAE